MHLIAKFLHVHVGACLGLCFVILVVLTKVASLSSQVTWRANVTVDDDDDK